MTVEGEALAFHAVYPEKVSVTVDYGRGRNAYAAAEAIHRVAKIANPGGILHMVGGSGVTTYQFRHELNASRVTFWYATEAESVRAGAGVQDALVALAGTGAFGHLHVAGKGWHADGYGPLMGDWGGGYQIGREGLRAALRSFIHPHRDTALRIALAREMGVTETDPGLQSVMITEGIRIFADRPAVAGHAGMVDWAARQGDAVAIRILEQAAGELAETLQLLVERAGVGGEPLPFVGSGGVIQKSDVYWDSLVRSVTAFLPRCRPIRQTLPQSAGLAMAGLAQAVEAGEAKADVEKARARLFETLPKLVKADRRKGAA